MSNEMLVGWIKHRDVNKHMSMLYVIGYWPPPYVNTFNTLVGEGGGFWGEVKGEVSKTKVPSLKHTCEQFWLTDGQRAEDKAIKTHTPSGH